jgi:hypothetical protein
MDRLMLGRLVGAIPNLPAAGVVVPSLLVGLSALPSREPAVMSVAPVVVGRIPVAVAPNLEG